MNNLSQNNKMFDNEPKNNEKRLTELISTIYNEFKFIGKVINEPKKDILNKKIVCYIRLALQSGVIVDLRAYNKVAEEIATVYKKGDVVAFRGQVLATKKDVKLDEEKDVVCIDGEKCEYNKYIYIMLNKPQGVPSAVLTTISPLSPGAALLPSGVKISTS